MGRWAFFILLWIAFSACGRTPEERTAEIYAARTNPGEDALETVESGLADPDAHVRTAALTAWVGLRGAEAVPAVRAALADSDRLVRTVAAKLAGDLGDASLVEGLTDRALSDTDAWVRRRALASLLQFRDPALAPHVLRALEDPDREVRLEAAKGLPWLGDAVETARLVEILESEPDWEVRVQAARALAGRTGPDAARALEAAREDESEYVRAAAFRALRGEMQGPIPGVPGRVRDTEPSSPAPVSPEDAPATVPEEAAGGAGPEGTAPPESPVDETASDAVDPDGIGGVLR